MQHRLDSVKPLYYLACSQTDSFPDIQMSNNTRPQSPVPMEGHIPKMSSSPPKAASGWPSLNPAHKKGTSTVSETFMSRFRAISRLSWEIVRHRSDIPHLLSDSPQQWPHSPHQKTSVRKNTAVLSQMCSTGLLSAPFSASPAIGLVCTSFVVLYWDNGIARRLSRQ